MKKKRIRETLAVVLVISILSACAGPKQEGGSEPAASAEPEGTRTEEPAASAEDAANQEDALSETVSNNEDTVQGNLSGAAGELRITEMRTHFRRKNWKRSWREWNRLTGPIRENGPNFWA